WAEEIIKNMNDSMDPNKKTEGSWTTIKILEDYHEHITTTELFEAIENLMGVDSSVERKNAFRLLSQWVSIRPDDNNIKEWNKVGDLIVKLKKTEKLSEDESQKINSFYQKTLTGLVEIKHYKQQSEKTDKNAIVYEQTRKKLNSISEEYKEFKE